MLAAISYLYLKSRIADSCKGPVGKLVTFYEKRWKLNVMAYN